MSEAVVEALEHWPEEGIPERPGAWLLTTARRRGLDRLRREARYREKLAQLAALPETPDREPDDRLRLIFTCCHPALRREAQMALTLRAVVGLTTDEIARAFLVPEPTVAKRIVRAKRKIATAGIPYHMPASDELRSRLDEVLTVIYLLFNEGHLTTTGGTATRRDLARDAEWLAMLVTRLLPAEPEALGLLALIRLALARWPARVRENGELVLLEGQDRSLWDRPATAQAVRLIESAAAMGRPGRYQLEAAIAAVHAEALTYAGTDGSPRSVSNRQAQSGRCSPPPPRGRRGAYRRRHAGRSARALPPLLCGARLAAARTRPRCGGSGGRCPRPHPHPQPR